MKTFKKYLKRKVNKANHTDITLFEFPTRKFIVTLFMLFILCISGCHDPNQPPENTVRGNNDQSDQMSVYAQYTPVKIDVLPLTEYKINSETQEGEINLFVSLIDAFGSQIKSPCIFRFELYSKVQRSSDPKGGRMRLWSDLDLIEPTINHSHWRDFLRAYRFNLPYELQSNQSYILEVTCICPNTRHITTEYTLNTTSD